MQIAMLQDKIVPFEQVDSNYFDRGLFFGDGVYEVIRSYKGQIFALEDHLQRFAQSLEAIEIKNVDIGIIREKLLQAFKAASIADAKIYFHITRGSGPRNHLWKADMKPNFFLTIEELHNDPKEKIVGISVSTYPDTRWKRCDIKSLNLLPNILARNDAAKKGCGEAIFVDDAGFITEGAASAFFAIIGKTLQSAPLTANVLPSITRKFVLKAAKSAGLDICERLLTPQLAADASELFIAVTTKDIVPVVKFDGKVIADGRPGKYTKKLEEEFHKFIE
jgi:D-alanine transaminase